MHAIESCVDISFRLCVMWYNKQRMTCYMMMWSRIGSSGEHNSAHLYQPMLCEILNFSNIYSDKDESIQFLEKMKTKVRSILLAI